MKPARPNRRQLLLASAAATLTTPWLSSRAALSKPHVGALFAGKVDDGGFMQAGYEGLERARSELAAVTTVIDGVAPKKDLLAAALMRLAEAGPALVIAHGGQNNEAAVEVAARFPQVMFVVTQGAVTGANLASYEVLQEESAYLAGVLAASISRSGIVGHMSGIRVRPGLKGRAAYAAGVRATASEVKLLSNFSGQQDDNALSRRVALAMVEAGADVIFTMLNAGRLGVTEVCREKRINQIGNVVDWVRTTPDVFIGSAVADVGMAVFDAVRDLAEGRFQAGVVRKLGLDTRQAVRLSMARDVPSGIQARVAAAADDIRSGKIRVPLTYDGAEFPTPP